MSGRENEAARESGNEPKLRFRDENPPKFFLLFEPRKDNDDRNRLLAVPNSHILLFNIRGDQI